MKPPPPMLPAVGCVTASANAVATTASIALPPSLITSAPIREAISLCDATMPRCARTGTVLAPIAIETTAQMMAMRPSRSVLMMSSGPSTGGLYALGLPMAAAEERDAHERHHRERERHGEEDARQPEPGDPSEEIRERDLAEPQAADVDERRRLRVARAVERLRQHVAVRVEREAGGDDSQPARGDRPDDRIGREGRDDCVGERDEEDRDGREKRHVVERREPDRRLRAIRFLRAEVLADERRGGVRQPP